MCFICPELPLLVFLFNKMDGFNSDSEDDLQSWLDHLNDVSKADAPVKKNVKANLTKDVMIDSFRKSILEGEDADLDELLNQLSALEVSLASEERHLPPTVTKQRTVVSWDQDIDRQLQCAVSQLGRLQGGDRTNADDTGEARPAAGGETGQARPSSTADAHAYNNNNSKYVPPPVVPKIGPPTQPKKQSPVYATPSVQQQLNGGLAAPPYDGSQAPPFDSSQAPPYNNSQAAPYDSSQAPPSIRTHGGPQAPPFIGAYGASQAPSIGTYGGSQAPPSVTYAQPLKGQQGAIPQVQAPPVTHYSQANNGQAPPPTQKQAPPSHYYSQPVNGQAPPSSYYSQSTNGQAPPPLSGHPGQAPPPVRGQPGQAPPPVRGQPGQAPPPMSGQPGQAPAPPPPPLAVKDQSPTTSPSKEDKIRQALQRLQSASIQRLFVRAHDENGGCKSIMVDESMSVARTVQLFMVKNLVQPHIHYCLVEKLPALHMERLLEDHYNMVQVILQWGVQSTNELYFCKRKDKYILKGPMELASTVYLRIGKKWKNVHLVLKDNALFYDPKKKKNELRLIQALQYSDIYRSVEWKKHLKAPTDFGFALKPSDVQTPGSELIHYVCVDDEMTLTTWMASIRLAKHGAQLLTNLQLMEDAIRHWDQNALTNTAFVDYLAAHRASVESNSVGGVRISKAPSEDSGLGGSIRGGGGKNGSLKHSKDGGGGGGGTLKRRSIRSFRASSIDGGPLISAPIAPPSLSNIHMTYSCNTLDDPSGEPGVGAGGRSDGRASISDNRASICSSTSSDSLDTDRRYGRRAVLPVTTAVTRQLAHSGGYRSLDQLHTADDLPPPPPPVESYECCEEPLPPPPQEVVGGLRGNRGEALKTPGGYGTLRGRCGGEGSGAVRRKNSGEATVGSLRGKNGGEVLLAAGNAATLASAARPETERSVGSAGSGGVGRIRDGAATWSSRSITDRGGLESTDATRVAAPATWAARSPANPQCDRRRLQEIIGDLARVQGEKVKVSKQTMQPQVPAIFAPRPGVVDPNELPPPPAELLEELRSCRRRQQPPPPPHRR